MTQTQIGCGLCFAYSIFQFGKALWLFYSFLRNRRIRCEVIVKAVAALEEFKFASMVTTEKVKAKVEQWGYDCGSVEDIASDMHRLEKDGRLRSWDNGGGRRWKVTGK